MSHLFNRKEGNINYKIKRCPWCGVSFISSLFVNKCENCANDIKPYYSKLTWIIILIVGIIFTSIMFYFLNTYTFIFLLLLTYYLKFFINSYVPYIKQSDKYIHQKRQFAEIKLYDNNFSKVIFPRFIIIENQIFTVCFVNKEQTPISNMICIATESIKWNKKSRNFKCVLAYLPLGKLDKEYDTETKFFFFMNNKKIGEGILGDIIIGANEYC